MHVSEVPDRRSAGYPEDPEEDDDDFDLSTFGLGRGNRGKRKQRKPPPKVQQELLVKSENRCVYCGNEFGWWISRHGEMQFVALVWDHFLPYTVFGNRKDGYVPACSHCNSIKGDRIFTTVDEASEYIRERRQKLGFAD